MVTGLFLTFVCIPFLMMPGKLPLIGENWVLFQAASVQCVGIGLFMSSMSSESFLSSIRAWWMKLFASVCL